MAALLLYVRSVPDGFPLLSLCQDVVRLWPPIAVERPLVANLLDPVEVEISHDKLCRRVRSNIIDVLASRVNEVGRSVEVVVAKILDADTVDRTDVVHVRNGSGWLFDLP